MFTLPPPPTLPNYLNSHLKVWNATYPGITRAPEVS